jgi:hypothetical protein
MIQPTSLDAYQNLKIGPRQRIIFLAFWKYGAVTNLEISTWEKIPINQVTPRTNELVKLGFIVESHKRKCSVSGRIAIAWRVQHG